VASLDNEFDSERLPAVFVILTVFEAVPKVADRVSVWSAVTVSDAV